jgi:hypothetical protein
MSARSTAATYLKTTIVYLPVLLAVVVLHLAFTFHDEFVLPSDALPWTDRPTGPEVVLEKRGLLGDACVALLGHMVVYLSGEAPVRVAAKLSCAAHMALLTYFGPFTVAAYARTAQGSARFNAAVADTNFWICAGCTVVNLVGAGILYADDRHKVKKA